MRPYVTFLISLFLLLLLQNVQVFIMCRQTMAGGGRHRFGTTTALASSTMEAEAQHSILNNPIDSSNHKKRKNNNNNNNNENYQLANKRTIIDGFGQTEELLPHQTLDQIESNYDEYPMVVPKRAELMLDRLMLALHRAIEKERNSERGSSLNDFYLKAKNDNHLQEQDPDAETGFSYSMYSDDDPSVMMDYDFKDLNSINRATGESFRAKKFQRRALGGGGNDEVNGSKGFKSDESGNINSNNVNEDDDDDDEDGVFRVGLGNRGHLEGDTTGANGGNGEVRVQRVSTLVAAANDNLDGGRNTVGNTGRMYWRCYFNAVSCF